MNLSAHERADSTPAPAGETRPSLWIWLPLGVLFGVTLTKAEVVSWFRIQEMFRFQAFHMYGIIGSAIAVGAASNLLIGRRKSASSCEAPSTAPVRTTGWGYRYWLGGAVFGLGWALTGACPGPLFALVGAGVTVMIVAILSALAGTWVYSVVRDKLPH